MVEEFQGGVSCGGNWWNSSNDVANFDWLNHDMMMDIKATRSSDYSAGFSRSTSPDDWNHDLYHDSGRSEGNYSDILQQVARLDSSMDIGGDSFSNSSEQVNGNYPLQQHPLNSIDKLSVGFPLLNSFNSYNHTSSLLRTLFDTESDQPQQSLLDNNQPMNNYSNYNQINISNIFLPSLPAVTSTMITNNYYPLITNNPSFLPSTQSQFFPSSLSNKKRNLPSVHDKQKNEEARDLASHVEPAIKRARIQTPSPLQTFKARKEKLGGRVTALQQLVSPFGKTDTASVLHEAIGYIKFLHDQVSVLSTPYLENGSPPLQNLQADNKAKDQETQDFKSRGLCLVPISSTFPVTVETATDFWTSIFGESFK